MSVPAIDDRRPIEGENIDLEDDSGELDEWKYIGNLMDGDGAPIYYNPETQQMAWLDI